MLRWRRLNRTDGIGGRKAVDQAGYQFRVDVPIGQGGFMGADGMPVVCRGIEFLSHVEPPSYDNASAIRTFPNMDGMSPKLCNQGRFRQVSVRTERPPQPQNRSGAGRSGQRNFRHMINIAQTDGATSDRLCLRWDCTLIVEVDSRRSRIKFRPQPVWSFNSEKPLTQSPDRRTARSGSRLPKRPAIADLPLAIVAIVVQRTKLPGWHRLSRHFSWISQVFLERLGIRRDRSLAKCASTVYQERHFASRSPFGTSA
jgi:hypothetical protein